MSPVEISGLSPCYKPIVTSRRSNTVDPQLAGQQIPSQNNYAQAERCKPMAAAPTGTAKSSSRRRQGACVCI